MFTSVEIKPELSKNILNFGYGINFKYEGILMHSFNNFYVVTEFILHSINDLKFSTINFKETCNYLQEKNGCSVKAKHCISDLIVYCKKKVPFIHYHKEQIPSFNCTVHNILTNEILLIVPKLPKTRKGKRGIVTSLMSGLIGLAYESISSFLHNWRQKALHNAVKAMETKINIQHNKFRQDSMVMYGVYNIEKAINTIHQMHNTTIPNEKFFTGELGKLLLGMLIRMEFITML